MNEEQKLFMRKYLDNLQKVKEDLLVKVRYENILPIFMLDFYKYPTLRASKNAYLTYVEWYILNHEFEDGEPDNSNTFKEFLSDYLSEYDLTFKEIEAIKSWMNSKPSIYLILSVDTQRSSAIFTDIFSRQDFSVDLTSISHQDYNIENLKDTLVISTLLKTPVEGEYLPFLNINSLPKEAEENIWDMVPESILEPDLEPIHRFYPLYEQKQQGINQYFVRKVSWKKKVYKQAANEFLNNIYDLPYYSADSIWTALIVWHDYANSKIPSIKNPKVVAAAMENFITNLELEIDFALKFVSQKDLGIKYDVSPASIAEYKDILVDHYKGTLPNDLLVIEDIEENNDIEDLEDLEKLEDLKNKILQNITTQNTNISITEEENKINSAQDMFVLAEDSARKSKYDLAIEFLKNAEKLLRDNPEGFNLYYSAKMFSVILWCEKGEFEVAIKKLNQVLELELDDEREKVVEHNKISILIEMEKYEEAKELIAKYDKDDSAHIIYCKVLLEYINNGFENKDLLHDMIRKAHNQNLYVAKLICNFKQDFISSNPSEEEADEASFHFGVTRRIWDKYPEVVDDIQKICLKR